MIRGMVALLIAAVPVWAMWDTSHSPISYDPTPLAAPVYASSGDVTDAAAVDELTDRLPSMQLTEPPTPPPAPTTTVPLPPHYDSWLRIAQCESSGDWAINTGNGFYGGLQFTLSSWRGAGGSQFAAYPHRASMLEQMWTAERLLQLQGWGAWPVCSRYR